MNLIVKKIHKEVDELRQSLAAARGQATKAGTEAQFAEARHTDDVQKARDAANAEISIAKQ